MSGHNSVNQEDAHHGGGHHIQPLDIYLKVFGTLLVLTVITVWVAQFDFGKFNGFIAMFVATIKAAFVAMYFMNLKHDNKLYAVILVTAVAFLLLLFGFSIFDFDTRVPEVNPI